MKGAVVELSGQNHEIAGSITRPGRNEVLNMQSRAR
jgi:hypothetical protein